MAIQYYANADANGNIIAFYNDDIWDPAKIPTTAIKITQAQWQDSITNPGKYTVQAGVFVLASAPTVAQQLATAQANQIASLTQSYRQASTSTFTSNATGTMHTYYADVDSQTKFNAAMKRLDLDTTGAITSVNWLTVDANVVTHTPAQLRKVFTDGFDYEQSLHDKLMNLIAQVKAATTVAQVQAIVW